MHDFINGGAANLVTEFTETESGKRNDRPQLAEALAVCKKQKAKLVFAKLDRLARNEAFISNLMGLGADFVAVDRPGANRLTIHILAAERTYLAGASGGRDSLDLDQPVVIGETGNHNQRVGGPDGHQPFIHDRLAPGAGAVEVFLADDIGCRPHDVV